MRRRTTYLGILTFLVISMSAQATPFTDEAAWRTAVGNVFAFENFDSIVAGTSITQLPALGIAFDPLNDGSQPTVQAYAQTGGMVRSSPNNLLNDSDFSLPGRGPYNMRAINPADLVFGVGLWNVGGDDQLRMTFFDSADNIVEQVVSASGIGFFGIVNPLGGTRVQIDFVGGNGYAPVDDLQTAVRGTFEPNPVPEPTSLSLVAVALGTWASARRRVRT
ncbi:MAG: PEP-CTERM sorting domain-containing protein [Phycisphaerales bacterium]